MTVATVYSGNKAGWLTQVAIQIQDGGDKPPSRTDLLRWVPDRVGTARNDGHVTAAENGYERRDYHKGYEIWIDGAVQALRDAGLIEGNGNLRWAAAENGTWKVPFSNQTITVRGKAERAKAQAKSEMQFLLNGYSDISVKVETRSKGQTFFRDQVLSTHPLALAIPPMTEEEQRVMRASIEQGGVDVPVVLYPDENDLTPRGKAKEKILDGRHRAYFASVTGKPIKLEHFTGTPQQARDKVAKLNLHRRHLTPQQLALSIVKLYGEQAKVEADDAHRQAARQPRNAPGDPQEPAERYDREWPARAVKMAGSPPGVTPDTVRAMAPLTEPGMEEVAEEVESGEVKSTAEVTRKVKAKRGEKVPTKRKGSVGQNITAPRSAFRRMGEALGQLEVVRQDWEKDPEASDRIERTPAKWAEMLERADKIIEVATWLRGEVAKGAGRGF